MIEEYLEGIIEDLSLSSVVCSFSVIKREAGEEDGYIRIKCTLANGGFWEFAEYVDLEDSLSPHHLLNFH